MKTVEWTTSEKKEAVEKYLHKLMGIAEKALKRKNYDLAFSALSAYCKIQYSVNQIYTDTKVEDILLTVSKDIVKIPDVYKGEENTVLFYDGFGLDLRGWGISFARVLSELRYNVIYVVPSHQKGKIPHIVSEIEGGCGKVVYIDMKKSYMDWLISLNELFNRYTPKAAFFYTTPNDVVGATVFDAYKGKVKRIQIDLTDHAFWIGINAFDLVIDSRMPGLSNMVFYRGISKDKIMIMDCCPYINREINPSPFPFDIEHEEYFFSGGSLYKTLGDEDLLFYKMVDHILTKHESIKFLFAGSGDDSEMKKIVDKYPGRAYHIQERSDFIRMFEHCVFFLNTYPMFGGLMMRFAATKGKVPLTLKHGSDHEGILKNQWNLGIEFDTYEEAVSEADKLILDEKYRKEREKEMKAAVVTEQEFGENVRSIIEESRIANASIYYDNIINIDTTDFRAEFMERLNVDDLLLEIIPCLTNRSLAVYFPEQFIKKAFKKIKK